MKLPESSSGTPDELTSLDIIRTETALSRFPVHRIAKRGNVRIDLRNQATAILWKVTYNSEYGQPGPLAYKIDTLVINRRIEEMGRPVPKLIRLGSLRDICRELGSSEGGESVQQVRRALLQNASAFINAKITYRGADRSAKHLEAAFTRYSVIFTGEQLPDGRSADAVHLLLNDIYVEVLRSALTRPLDYEYMRSLSPGAQRFYEIVSYQVYAALQMGNPRAKLTYSDYCALSTQTRYYDWEHVKKQMYKVHRDHLKSGYLAKVEYEAATDAEGRPDWVMCYVPGPNAAAEFRAFRGGGRRALKRPAKPPFRQADLPLPLEEGRQAEPPMDDETSALVEQLVTSDLNRDRAVLYAKQYPAECRRQLEYVSVLEEGDFTSGRGAYLNEAIPGRFGPPKKYRQLRLREEEQKRRESETELQNARKAAQEARRDAVLTELKDLYLRLEDEFPELFAGFLAHVDKELNVLLRRFPARMAQEINRRIYAGESKRLELFAAYFEANPCPLPELTRWIQDHPPAKRKSLFTDRG